ncbi:choice-of-anchor R domain-containing protein [Synechocystis sp. CACIAM 05]|uniref:choice-of-anchor R domain-containing protein n=1 Tax=Synechocystis sp. CACIAM 05 TaxID=1933929 RepID=UPI00138E81D9|nr:choice-of-anchor R domain-containing protein [Synechocystis sp. CACIAM 05]QHV01541.1 hypothetical protein BWK47_16325 [Synechocystis sp. CACIAM 05]
MKTTFTNAANGPVGTLSLAALSLAFSTPAEAVVLLGNLNQGNNSGATSLRRSSHENRRIQAISFTLPSGMDYDLDSVVLRLELYSASRLTLAIRDDVGGSDPGINTLVEFVPPPFETSFTNNYTFTPISPFTFAAETKYWLVATGQESNSVLWKGDFPGITPTGIATFSGSRFSADGGNSYSNVGPVNAFQINATPVPFESDALPVVGATLFMAGGLWWKKKRNQAKIAEFIAEK